MFDMVSYLLEVAMVPQKGMDMVEKKLRLSGNSFSNLLLFNFGEPVQTVASYS